MHFGERVADLVEAVRVGKGVDGETLRHDFLHNVEGTRKHSHAEIDKAVLATDDYGRHDMPNDYATGTNP